VTVNSSGRPGGVGNRGQTNRSSINGGGKGTGGGSQANRTVVDPKSKAAARAIVDSIANDYSGEGIGSALGGGKMGKPSDSSSNKHTYNWSVDPTQQPNAVDPVDYHDDPYAQEIMNAVYNGLGIVGGGVGAAATVAGMIGGGPTLSDMLGFDKQTSPVTGVSSYSHPSSTGQTHGDGLAAQQMQSGNGGGGASAPAAAPDTSQWTLDNIYNTLSHGAQGSDLYYLQQRGLAPMDASSIPDQWMPVFQREFDRIKGTVPTSVTSGATNGQFGDEASYNAALQQIGALFPSTIGQQALDAEQQRKQNTFKTGVGSLGLEGQVSSAFGDTSDDDILKGIYDAQYQPAATQLMNAFKRGALNPSGYNYGMSQLETQGKAGMGKLQDAGAAARATQSGGLNDYIQSIYNKASGWQLGQPDFDPTSASSEFTNRFNTAKSNLDSNLQGLSPSIFDVSSALRNAGTVQGTTSRGGLADTIANRSYQKRNQSRGIGSTGAF
jgi:hypothetical protein